MKNLMSLRPARRGEKTLYDASALLAKGRSTEAVKSSKDILWKGAKGGALRVAAKKREQEARGAKPKESQVRKKNTRFSLNNGPKGSGKKGKDLRKILLHQLQPTSRAKAFHFTDKVQLDTRSEFLGHTADSLVLEAQDQSLQAEQTPLKRKIKGKLRGGRVGARSPAKPKKKKSSQKQRFLEFQKRKIEKEIRSFHSLEPSSISNLLQRREDKSAQSSVKHDTGKTRYE